MPKLDFRLVLLERTLENNATLAEPLLFPVVLWHGHDKLRLRRALARWVRGVVKDCPPAQLYRRRVVGEPRPRRATSRMCAGKIRHAAFVRGVESGE